MNIRAIPTEYAGYKFRSRLEARWAYWFDALGFSWVYEPEGFEMEGICYLPDFRLNTHGPWVEVKPGQPDEKEWEKAKRLAMGSEVPVYMLIGVPTPFDARTRAGTHLLFLPSSEVVDSMCWGECGCCKVGRIDLLHTRRSAFELERLLIGRADWCSSINTNSARIRAACRAAKQERFETYPRNMRRTMERAKLI